MKLASVTKYRNVTIKGGSNIVKKVIKVVTIVRKVIVIILGYRHHT